MPVVVLALVGALSVVGVLFDAGVFAFQSVQYGAIKSADAKIDTNRAKVNCWARVLDDAVNGHKTRPQLLTEAKVCAKVP